MRVNGTAAGPTVATAPEAPASLVAKASDAQVTLIWTPPESDGEADIERYQYRYSAGSRVDPETDWADVLDADSDGWTDVPDADSDGSLADERSVIVTDLDNGRQYAFELRAVNSVRAGAAATATATPVAPLRTDFLVSNFRQPADGAAQITPRRDIVGVFMTGAQVATLGSIEFRLFSTIPGAAPLPSATLYRASSVTDTRVAKPGRTGGEACRDPGPSESSESRTRTRTVGLAGTDAHRRRRSSPGLTASAQDDCLQRAGRRHQSGGGRHVPGGAVGVRLRPCPAHRCLRPGRRRRRVRLDHRRRRRGQLLPLVVQDETVPC